MARTCRRMQEAVLAGDALALDDLGRRARRARGSCGSGAAKGRTRTTAASGKPMRPRVDLGAIAGDHAVALEAPHALGDRRRRQADAPPELGQREPAPSV